ncbi:MAG TPA: chemotaxis protein CheB [Acidobacteriaceae bacterium]|nr:chemotaxis protein CheB [Acidobacteriaceae bacterium]
MAGTKTSSKAKKALEPTIVAPNVTHRFPVVGIGASAGGLEAATSFFKELGSHLGMAYVLVFHLDPVRESKISEILARTTPIPVLQAKDGTRVEPDHIYVIPPNCEMTIDHWVLHLREREAHRSVNTTIDTFLRSLAVAHGSDAIGVILSGTASDGTLGIEAVKGEAGITFAQEPDSAKYDSMPASAIASGCVDFILTPAGIAKEIARIRHHPYIADHFNPEAEQVGDSSHMEQIFRLLRRSTTVDFSGYKSPTIARRIQRRMALQKIENLKDYGSFLHRNAGEVEALYQDLLINVTSFFRNPEAFAALKQVVYPAVLEARTSRSGSIRIWVPGCSTGEEAYSHAISIVEFLGEGRADTPIQVFGTDLSDSAIQRARVGVYKENIEADVTLERLRRFFYKADGGYQIKKTIRDMCIFSTQNVFNDPPFSRMDLVSCRNVMIYLSQLVQKKVIPIFHYALNPTGFLMLGSTEGLLGAGSELFEMTDKKQKIFRKRLVSAPVAFGFSMDKPEHETSGIQTVTAPSKSQDTFKIPMELQREADRLLLARYVPPAVLINEHLEILQTRGSTSSFLELPSGKASLNLLKMARPGMLFELQSAIDAARKQGFEAIRQHVRVEGEKTKAVTIRVVPFKIPAQTQHSFLIVFESEIPGEDGFPGAALARQPGAPLVVEPGSQDDESSLGKQIMQLRQELAATREYLQSIIESQEGTNEELQSANEEIQSGNEELQSTNEELQTSKEELESANEELHTVNEEMQHRNELLTQLNNDLTNLLYSVSLPIVMVGADLSVRRFTPQAAAVLGLTSSDIGRPMPRLRLKLDMGSLEQNMLDVIQQVQSQQLHVQDNDGKWCILRIVPYRTMDNRIDGVVLSVMNEMGGFAGNTAGTDGAGKAPARKEKSGSKAAAPPRRK